MATIRPLGVWRSLVARSVRVGEVPSSNLGTPIEEWGNPGFPHESRKVQDSRSTLVFLPGASENRLSPMRLLLAVFLACLACCGVASAGTGLILGVADDDLKWTEETKDVVLQQQDAGFKAVRITLRWKTGQTQLDDEGRTYVRRAQVLRSSGSASSSTYSATRPRRRLRPMRARPTAPSSSTHSRARGT